MDGWTQWTKWTKWAQWTKWTKWTFPGAANGASTQSNLSTVSIVSIRPLTAHRPLKAMGGQSADQTWLLGSAAPSQTAPRRCSEYFGAPLP